ncbi:MAG TPA: thioesterase family protein [Nocardioidaceae bacterium]|nr:thioesterase family protein [Nocardioidaceae bacterium]
MTDHHYACHVRFSDVDVYGHVNNVKYFEYYQEARLAFVESLGWALDDPRPGFVVARIDVDYKRPILFRTEPYDVTTRVARVGTSSYHLDCAINDGESLLSTASVVMVRIDPGTGRPQPLTESERARLELTPRSC